MLRNSRGLSLLRGRLGVHVVVDNHTIGDSLCAEGWDVCPWVLRRISSLIQEVLVLTCAGLIYAKGMLKKLWSTGLLDNIKGGTDASLRNGCIAYIIAHLQRFFVPCNNYNGHRVNPIHWVLQTRVTKKKGEGACVQDKFCGHI